MQAEPLVRVARPRLPRALRHELSRLGPGFGPGLAAPGTSQKTSSFPSLPGLVALWSSDAGVTTVSGAVSAWADQSGNSHTLTQPTASQRPTYNASDVNFGGKPSFTFVSANGQALNSDPGLSVSQPLTVYQVCNITTTSHASFDCQFGGTFCRIRNFINHWDMSAGADLLGPSGTTSVAAVAAVFNGTSSVLYVNSSSAPTSGDAGAQNLTGGIAVGGNGSTIAALDGTLGFTAVYASAHSQANVSTLFTFLGGKFSQAWS